VEAYISPNKEDDGVYERKRNKMHQHLTRFSGFDGILQSPSPRGGSIVPRVDTSIGGRIYLFVEFEQSGVAQGRIQRAIGRFLVPAIHDRGMERRLQV
jgi:hypothetical protein